MGRRASRQPGTWRAGDLVIARYVLRHDVLAFPAWCVRDTGRELVTYQPHGTPYWGRGSLPSETRDAYARGDRGVRLPPVAPRRWINHMLAVRAPGQPFSVQWMWESPAWRLIQTYVNLETPFVRSSGGIHTRDHLLDVVVLPDGSCHVKDDDELTAKVNAGAVTARFAELVRGRAQHAIEQIRAGRYPFGAGWESWRPPAGWGVPPLPRDWRAGLSPVGLS